MGDEENNDIADKIVMTFNPFDVEDIKGSELDIDADVPLPPAEVSGSGYVSKDDLNKAAKYLKYYGAVSKGTTFTTAVPSSIPSAPSTTTAFVKAKESMWDFSEVDFKAFEMKVAADVLANTKATLGQEVKVKPYTEPKIMYNHAASPKTQKARGVKVLANMLGIINSAIRGTLTSEYFLITSKMSLNNFPKSGSKSKFRKQLTKLLPAEYTWVSIDHNSIMARPCPSVPRHGFVESRVVRSMNELRKVVVETRAADPRGEVLLAPFIEARYSSVVTDSSVSIGPSNDGATAGKLSVSIPCVSNLRGFFNELRLMKMLGGPYTEDGHLQGIKRTVILSPFYYAGFRPAKRGVYLEYVNDKCVQLRYGPIVSAANTWTPPDYLHYGIVRYVYHPSMDTLCDFNLFEKELIAKCPKIVGGCRVNSVLWLPGSTLSSHAAVQAISHGIAVVCGDAPAPKVGATYKFGATKVVTITKQAARKIIPEVAEFMCQNIFASELTYKQQDKHQLTWAIACIQGMASAPASELKLAMTVAAASIIIRLGMAACYGEHRRYYYSGPGGHSSGTPVGVTGGECKYPYPDIVTGLCDREYVWTKALSYDIINREKVYEYLGMLNAIEYDYRHDGWLQGMGGPRWAECTRLVTDVYMEFLELYNSATFKTPALDIVYNTTGIVKACNRFITACHNGGKCLSKFIAKTTFLQISEIPGVFLNTHLSYTISQYITYHKELDKTYLESLPNQPKETYNAGEFTPNTPTNSGGQPTGVDASSGHDDGDGDDDDSDEDSNGTD